MPAAHPKRLSPEAVMALRANLLAPVLVARHRRVGGAAPAAVAERGASAAAPAPVGDRSLAPI